MSRSIKVLQREDVFKRSIFRIEQITLTHERFDGSMSVPLTRLVLHRGDSVGVLLYDRGSRIVVLCEQFRVAATGKRDGWLLELPAGVLEGGDENSAAAARRELFEETGYTVECLQPIASVYLSPGGCSEQIHLFLAEVTAVDQTALGGGVPEEGEDIRLVRIPVGEAVAMAADGRILDAKTLIALQWLALQRAVDLHNHGK